MYRKTSAQSSLFELHTLFPNLMPKDDWCFIYRDHVYPEIDEEKFRHLFSETGGSPNKPIKVSLSLLIFMGINQIVLAVHG